MIDKQALQQTKNRCHEELDLMINKYNTNHYQIIKRFLKKDFYFFLWVSLIGIMIVIFSSFQVVSASLQTAILLFGIIGAIGIFQYIKDDYFETKDLLSMGYLNQGRSLLYMSLLITFFEIMTLFILLFLLPVGIQEKIAIILCAAFPVFLSQIIAMCFIEYMSHLFASTVVYFVSYSFSSLIFLLNDFYQFITLPMTFALMISVFVIYVLTIFIIYKQRKEKKYGINLRERQ